MTEYARGNRGSDLSLPFPRHWGAPPSLFDSPERRTWIFEHARSDAATARQRRENAAFLAEIDAHIAKREGEILQRVRENEQDHQSRVAIGRRRVEVEGRQWWAERRELDRIRRLGERLCRR